MHGQNLHFQFQKYIKSLYILYWGSSYWKGKLQVNLDKGHQHYFTPSNRREKRNCVWKMCRPPYCSSRGPSSQPCIWDLTAVLYRCVSYPTNSFPIFYPISTSQTDLSFSFFKPIRTHNQFAADWVPATLITWILGSDLSFSHSFLPFHNLSLSLSLSLSLCLPQLSFSYMFLSFPPSRSRPVTRLETTHI